MSAYRPKFTVFIAKSRRRSVLKNTVTGKKNAFAPLVYNKFSVFKRVLGFSVHYIPSLVFSFIIPHAVTFFQV